MTKDIFNILDNFQNQNLLVIGDIIVDQYIFCDAIGKSTESPTIVLKEKETENYLGGAGIVARHLKSLGAKVCLISYIGEDNSGYYVEEVLADEGIENGVISTYDKPTTLKKRFIAENYKLLRTSILDDSFISRKTEEIILKSINITIKMNKPSGIIISDFNYGVVTPTILKEIKKLAKRNKIKLFGDTQSSSQIGDFKQFRDYDLITPNLKEAHIALSEEHATPEKTAYKLLQKTKAKNIFLTLGKDGIILLNNSKGVVQFPAFNQNKLDVMGCGDSLLAASSLALCAGANFIQAWYIGSCMASVKLQTIGNIPIELGELKKAIRRYKKWL